MKKQNITVFYKSLLSTIPGLLLLMSIIPTNCYSQEAHPLADITKTAHDFVLNQIETTNDEVQVIVGRLDPRLRLHQCTLPLAAYDQHYETRQGLSTVNIRCNDSKPWTLYVPVSIKIFKMVATLKHAVIRNTVLTDDDIILRKMNINRLSSGYFDNIAQLKGKILTQNLAKGAVLTKNHTKAPTAIKRGQSVTLIAKNSVIEVRMRGTAMSRGAIGERIKVKNLNSKRIIEGVIIDKDLINVNL